MQSCSIFNLKKHKKLKIFTGTILGTIILLILYFLIRTPSHTRNWELGQEQLPQITNNAGKITINNLRDFIWHADNTQTKKQYISADFDLDAITSVDVIVSYFSENENIAHIFLNFNLNDDEKIGISIESRREIGEKFSPLQGIFAKYELIYVVATYRDVVGLRTNIRDEKVHLYPTIATPQQAQTLFLSLAEEINSINEKPRFYNTLSHNCTNLLSRQVEKLTDLDFPLINTIFTPGKIDETLYELEIIREPEETFQATKSKYLLD